MAGQVVVERPLVDSALIEHDQRLSRSLLWQIQRAFYQRQGIEAWSRGYVPFYITNNPMIAGAYARVVFGYLRDCLPALDLQEPVYILELGAGTGRFGFHFLRRLLGMIEASGLHQVRVTYLLTDIAGRNLDFWRRHPQLQPYLQTEKLALSVYDPAKDPGITLDGSGRLLAPGDLKNPLVVLANYFFDSIPQDVFSISNGMLMEGLVTLETTQPGLDPGAPAFLPGIRARFHQRFAPAEYYPDPTANEVLRGYARTLNETTLQMPCGALEVIHRLSELSGRRLLLVTGDRGYFRAEDLRGRGEPEINLHGGVVSMQVNFHALAEYFRLLGGQAFHAAHRAEGLVISAFLLGSLPGSYGETRLAFEEAVEQAGPDDFFMLKKAVEGQYAEFTLEQILAYVRLSGYDATIFTGCVPALLRQIDPADLTQGELVYAVVERVRAGYYPIGEEINLFKLLAKVFIAISAYEDAMGCLKEAAAWYPADAETGEMMSVCQSRIEWGNE
jgi:hypothetical protein